MNRIGILVGAAGCLLVGPVFAQETPSTTANPPAQEVTPSEGTPQKAVKCVPTGKCDMARVHFAFDSFALDDEAKATLDHTAECLKNNQNVQISISGSADSRGSVEYNQRLGQRRADAVGCYLKSRGVEKNRVSTLSLGKEHPICGAKTETCFAQNRNATITSAPATASR
jgi:peptidoglycan-associated lipoprotein